MTLKKFPGFVETFNDLKKFSSNLVDNFNDPKKVASNFVDT